MKHYMVTYIVRHAEEETDRRPEIVLVRGSVADWLYNCNTSPGAIHQETIILNTHEITEDEFFLLIRDHRGGRGMCWSGAEIS